MLCALCVGQASALEYTMEAPDDYLFGRPTSDDTIYEWEDPNVDRSKNTALIPPGFGTPTSYLPGSGDPLTPNLIPSALDGGGLVSQTGSVNYPVIDTENGGSSGQDVGYTAVTSDLYYSGGHLGTLKIPAIGLSTKVYEGTDSSTLAKGAGHFPGTSIWDGNCCIAGHNRGVRDDFGDLHTLEPGDTITWTTKLGTRTYQVVSVEKVLETDTSGTATTSDNRITLFTCVRDQRAYRWCVQAVECYVEVIRHADMVRCISREFSYSAYQRRNEWMVDHSGRVNAVYTGERGGTRNTIAYAKQQHIPCVMIMP